MLNRATRGNCGDPFLGAGLSGENEKSRNRRCSQVVRHPPTSWPGLSHGCPVQQDRL